MYYCCGITEKGVMPHNEDAVLIGGRVFTNSKNEQLLEAPFIAAVSDGVSGENSGELASVMCLENVRLINNYEQEKFRERLFKVHNRLAEFSRNNSESLNMQATLCGIAVDMNGTVMTFNVGDSRLYRFRGGTLKQLSRDQSLVQLLYEEGEITHEERRTHIHKNIIFPVLGNVKDTPEFDLSELDGGFCYGDILIICTDGLSDYISNDDMLEILEMPRNLSARLELLIKKALENGSRDNISVVAVVMTGNIMRR